MTGGQDEVLEQIYEANRQIESDGKNLTISQREDAAREHIRRTLAHCGRMLLILGELKAAEHCESAKNAIGQPITRITIIPNFKSKGTNP